MGIEKKPLRYAHSDGHTDVCYSEDGKHLITCGTDGDIRIWAGFDDDDPAQTCVGEWSLCVCQKANKLYVATDNNNVQLMTFPEAERDGILTRFTAHVNHMAICKDHNLIAIASEDLQLKVLKLTESTEDALTFSGPTAPALSTAISPKGTFLSVSSGDGYLRVWNVEDQALVKEIECVPKANSFTNAKLLCRIDFEPTTGKTLAYPAKNTIIILNTGDWSSKLVLMCTEIESPYSIVQFSPCGNLIAAASQQGDIVVWEIHTQNVIGIINHPRSLQICAMVWNPSGNGEIAFCDVKGQLGLLSNCVSEVSADIEGGQDTREDDANSVNFDGFEMDDDDDENVISLEKIKNETLGIAGSESNVDREETGEQQTANTRFIMFRLGITKIVESVRSLTPRPRTPQVPLQDIFMPTSTPEHLNPRYLCWNEVGIIRSYGSIADNEETSKSIEVEFHDTTLHNSMMMQNFHEYTMGCLSETALAVANSSQITIIPLGSGSKEWLINMPDDEEILCIANSNNLVCLYTSGYQIRVYSIYGTQKSVFSIPGPLVSMSACNNFLLVAYHSGAPRRNDQCISLLLVKLEGMTIESKNINSALRPETNLQWLGFTDVGTPGMQDSYGMLYIYPISSNIWIPSCDTTKYRNNPSDGFFVTAVFESQQTVRGIRCRGVIYPSFTPRPTLSELPLEAPFVEMSTEKSQLESSLFLWSSLRIENTDKKFKETALKAFALSCKNNLDQRAFELVEMMANSQLVTLATKYASKLNRQRLAEKLAELASNLQDDDFETSSLSLSAIASPLPKNIKPLHRKLVLSSAKKRNSKINKTVEDEENSASAPVDVEVANGADVSTSKDSNISDMSINTQESVFSEEEPKNPFLKRLRKDDPNSTNPLSLTDKFAGYLEEQKKEIKPNKENKDKRKKPESADTDPQKNKQRKLDKFIFSKRS